MSEVETINVGWISVNGRKYYDKRDMVGFLKECEKQKTKLDEIIEMINEKNEGRGQR